METKENKSTLEDQPLPKSGETAGQHDQATVQQGTVQGGLKPGMVELGRFRVGSLNDAGAEGRFLDEKNQSNLISRNRKANKMFQEGQIILVYGVVDEEVPVPERTLVEVPTKSVATLPEGSKTIEV